MNKQMQSEFVYAVTLGEGERFAHEATESLAQGVVEAFDVAGLARAFAAGAVGAPGKD